MIGNQRRHPVRRTVVRLGSLAATLALASLAGCGDDDGGVSVSSPGWRAQVLGEPGSDTQALLVGDGDALVAVTTDARGVLGAWVAGDDGRFVEATTPATPGRFVSAAAAGDGGFVAAGRTDDFVHVALWFSDDGTRWTEVHDDVFDRPADITSVVAIEDGFVATGALRSGADPTNEPFEAAAWWSEDGREWTLVELDVDGGLGAVTSVGDVLLAAGGDGIWRSDDDGRTWREGDIDMPPGVDAVWGLGSEGGTLVLVDGDTEGVGGGGRAWSSDDLGASWMPAELPEQTAHDVGNSLWLGDRTVLGLVGYEGGSIDPAACYVHLSACQGGQPDAHVATSDDGRTWHRLDLSGIEPAPPFTAHDVGRLDGRVVVLGTSVDGDLTAWTWGGDQPPVATTTTTTAPAEPAPPMATHGDTLESDVRYRFPLYIHCGMGVLGTFNGTTWTLLEASGPTPESGAGDVPPAHWPVGGQTIYGFVTLVAPDRIEYTIGDGEVIAVYAPDSGAVPGCA